MKKITRSRIEKFLAINADNGRTLDIGAGDDYYGNYFPNKVTVDVDPARKPEIIADIVSLPFEANEFDNVLCTEVLEHISDPKAALKELARVLKPGGKLILTTRFIFPLHDVPGDFFRFTKYGLRELLHDWEIVTLEPEAGTLETVAVLLQRLIFQAKYKGNSIIKGLLVVFIRFFLWGQRFLLTEYGNIGQTESETEILSSGYYLVARKH